MKMGDGGTRPAYNAPVRSAVKMPLTLPPAVRTVVSPISTTAPAAVPLAVGDGLGGASYYGISSATCSARQPVVKLRLW